MHVEKPDLMKKNKKYSCPYRCSRVTCERCVVVGVSHARCECEWVFRKVHGIDSKYQHTFRGILERISRQFHVYENLDDWYQKEIVNKK